MKWHTTACICHGEIVWLNLISWWAVCWWECAVDCAPGIESEYWFRYLLHVSVCYPGTKQWFAAWILLFLPKQEAIPLWLRNFGKLQFLTVKASQWVSPFQIVVWRQVWFSAKRISWWGRAHSRPIFCHILERVPGNATKNCKIFPGKLVQWVAVKGTRGSGEGRNHNSELCPTSFFGWSLTSKPQKSHHLHRQTVDITTPSLLGGGLLVDDVMSWWQSFLGDVSFCFRVLSLVSEMTDDKLYELELPHKRRYLTSIVGENGFRRNLHTFSPHCRIRCATLLWNWIMVFAVVLELRKQFGVQSFAHVWRFE